MKQLSMTDHSFNKTKTHKIVPTHQKAESSDVLQRIAAGDRSAVKECIDNFGNLIWALAKKFTHSNEDAEAVTQEIFLEIWRCAARFEQSNFDEQLFITLIVRSQLRKYSEKSKPPIS